jgi:signal transduction histidine kinase
MYRQISCPRCNYLVNPQESVCSQCGIDLAISAVLAERQLIKPAKSSPPASVTPEILVPRLGEYLVEKGELLPSELDQALNYQVEKARLGRPLLLGQALLELNMIERETLDEVVTLQILELQEALRRSNRELEARVDERTQDLEKALDKLTELNQLKANFIANISHELRTPLTHIKGYLDLLYDEELGPLTVDQMEALAVVKQSEYRLESLIEDLIQFALASRGDLSLNLTPVNLVDMIQKIIEQYSIITESANISLLVDVPSDLPPVHCDQEKISWVLQQLIDNAIKFTMAGGVLKIEAHQRGAEVSIAISDSGIGISSDQQEEIFEPFHQLDGSSTRRYRGTGLGLALSNRIVDAHGARIEVVSSLGVGSRFSFSLPVVEKVLEI